MERHCPQLLKSLRFGVVVLNEGGEVLLINDKARKILGMAEKAKVQALEPAIVNMKSVIRTGTSNLAVVALPGGRRVIVNASPFDMDGAAGALCIILTAEEFESSVTREMDSFKKLAHDLEAIVENTYDGLYICDGRANTLKVNKAYQRITGISAKEVIGRNMKDLVAAGVYDRSVTLEVLEKRRPVTIVQELRGGKRTLVTGNPVFDQKKEIVLVVTSVRDITELVELKSKVHEQTLELNRYASELDKIKTLKEQQDRFVTANKKTIDLLETATKAARFDSNLLITGESGVGKGLLARMIHEASERKAGQFVSINCAGIPDELFESELFGYEPGAFSGASSKGKKGLLEVADKGTVFLDEIGDMSLKIQAKLLHVIEDKEMTRLGSTKTIRLDVRMIAATNQNLPALIAERKFRQDLFFRLNTISLVIPALRERPEDVVLLVTHFLSKLNERYKTDKRFSPRAIQALTSHPYPGNARELANVVEQAFLVSKERVIHADDLPFGAPHVPIPEALSIDDKKPFHEVVEGIQYRMLKSAVEKYGSTRKAAKRLGVHQSTIVRRMNKVRMMERDADEHR